ncbi:lipopolysaccharide biosynthesis protein [Flavobacterium croceum]|uniref:lipopolysaccharide biosynthesis protein n=1 Tax=Flavobacterium croceum TaxID=370975 RepID=UPI0024A7F1F0|nr:oligosaccharide flippase family protein [Flavobacterium croceum]
MLKVIKKILLNKQVHNLGIYGFGQLFNLITPLVVAPYIVNTCGEENFGKTAVGMAISFFLIVFIDYGSEIVGVREVSVNRNNLKQLEKIFYSTFMIKACALLFIIICSLLIINFVPYFQKESKMFILGLMVLIGQFLSPNWFLQGIENVKWITLLNFISKMIYLLAVFKTIKQTNDYVYINFWWGIGMIVGNFTVVMMIVMKYKFFNFNISIKDIILQMKRDFSMFSSQIFVSIQLYSPVVIISALGNNFLAGQYRIIDQVIVMFKTYILLFFNFVFPKICYLIENNPKKGIKNWVVYNGFNFILVILAMTIIYFFSYDVVSYFNPSNRYILSNLMKIGVFIPVLLSISIPLKQLILGYNFKNYYVKATYIIVVFNVLLISIFLKTLFVYGVLYSIIISEIIMIFLYIYKLRPIINYD